MLVSVETEANPKWKPKVGKGPERTSALTTGKLYLGSRPVNNLTVAINEADSFIMPPCS
jgi:hypothetical protein